MNQLPDTPKRFIAGAKCPECQKQDKLVMFRQSGQQYRECVACGFTEKMNFEPNFRELDTRVNRDASEREADIAPVRLLVPMISPKPE